MCFVFQLPLDSLLRNLVVCGQKVRAAASAAKEINLSVPLVVRLAGTNVKSGKKILSESGLKIISASNLSEAAKKIIEVTK